MVEVKLKNSEIRNHDGVRICVPTSSLAKAQVTLGWIWADISISFKQTRITLSGLTNRRAEALFDTSVHYAEEELRIEFKTLFASFNALFTEVENLFNQERYIRAYDMKMLLSSTQDNINYLPRFEQLLKMKMFSDQRLNKTREQLTYIKSLITEPHKLLASRNAEFVHNEKQNPKWRAFFERVEKTALTDEQQDAVVIHEDRNRLIAAAGSGKSSTLVAKVGYAIAKGYVAPNEVLALAFNDKAAKEISERLNSRLGIFVKAKTFHSMGNEILKTTSGKKELATNTSQLFKNIIADLNNSDSDFLHTWLLYKAVYWQAEPEKEFDSVEAYEAYIRGACKKKSKDRDEWGIPTLRGDAVKSFEELAIANWLFIHGVSYQYEAQYEHDVTVKGWRKYEPDFLYETVDGVRVYHEHFALRADKTSPFGVRYKKSVDDKRALHAEHGSILIETTSADFKDGSIFVRLMQEFEARGIILNPKSSDELKELLKERNDQVLIKLMKALIAHAKESAYGESHFEGNAKLLRDGARTAVFLKLLFAVWREYTARITAKKSIDFSDMIGLAATAVENGSYTSTAKLILVDEFQDISPGRARLVKALLNQHPDSVLFGVGDDWQAINRFAGSDLSIMRDFEDHFGKTETRYLSKTFRSNQGISNVSARFVMKNDAQIAKRVEAVEQESVNVVRIIEYEDDEALKNHIDTKLKELALLSIQRKKIISVLIIGRYRYDTTKVITEADIDEWNSIHKGFVEIKKNVNEKKNTGEPLDSVHKSKGLEADFVLVQSLKAGWQFAFPCEMEDDPLLLLSFTNREQFAFAEERRLFYVALTRAREQVTLYSSIREPSRFVLELLDPAYGDMVLVEGSAEKPIVCSVCKQGYIKLLHGKYGDFYGCTSFRSRNCKGPLATGATKQSNHRPNKQ